MSRRDLSAGSQAVQSCHALRQFVAEHPETDRKWHETSRTLVLLSVENEKSLAALIEGAAGGGVRWAAFREPDLGGAITAVVLEPGVASRRLCRGLPLALTSNQ